MSARRVRSRPGSFPSPQDRLRRRVDFQRCYERGRRRHGALVSAYALENGRTTPRLGITVTRRVGGAVLRNRLRRRLREIYRRWDQRPFLPGLDFVVHVKPSAARASYGELERETRSLLAALSRRRPA